MEDPHSFSSLFLCPWSIFAAWSLQWFPRSWCFRFWMLKGWVGWWQIWKYLGLFFRILGFVACLDELGEGGRFNNSLEIISKTAYSDLLHSSSSFLAFFAFSVFRHNSSWNCCRYGLSPQDCSICWFTVWHRVTGRLTWLEIWAQGCTRLCDVCGVWNWWFWGDYDVGRRFCSLTWMLFNCLPLLLFLLISCSSIKILIQMDEWSVG